MTILKKRTLNQVPIVPGEVGTGPTGLCDTLPRAFGDLNPVIVYGHGMFTLMQVETNARITYLE